MGYGDTLTLDPSFADVSGGSSSVDLTSALMSDPTTGGGGIDWSGLASKYGPAILSGGKSALQSLGYTFGGGDTGAGSAPPLDTSIAVRAPSSAERAMQYGTRARGYFSSEGVHRYRHMNPCNPRALRRAIRRVMRFEHFAKQVLHITAPHRHVAGVKRHHRRRRHF